MLIAEPLKLSALQLRQLPRHFAGRYPVLFDSATHGTLGEWTILPIADGTSLWLDHTHGVRVSGAPIVPQHGFLATLDAWWQAQRTEPCARAMPGPWRPGWAVWLGYELAREIEPSLRLPLSPLGVEAFALHTPAALVFEHRSGQCWGVAEESQQVLLRSAVADATQLPEGEVAMTARRLLLPDSLHQADSKRFLDAVVAAQEAIAAGEVYQANLSREWTATLESAIDAADVYERLRMANPAPFAAWAQIPGTQILSSSPERLLRIDDGEISARPIAGTHPRSGGHERDAAETAALLAHAKERAEHVMLIDLERNDLGRVCVPGSVGVNEFMQVESYAHVHHIVSNIKGRLRPDVSPVGALRAAFPGGTITGCPKVRCMALIAQLEGAGRGAYTGSLGWLSTDGNADFNILIRTLTLQGKHLSFRAGAGIVADSVPELELRETQAKALGLLRALDPSF